MKIKIQHYTIIDIKEPLILQVMPRQVHSWCPLAVQLLGRFDLIFSSAQTSRLVGSSTHGVSLYNNFLLCVILA